MAPLNSQDRGARIDALIARLILMRPCRRKYDAVQIKIIVAALTALEAGEALPPYAMADVDHLMAAGQGDARG